MNCQVDTGVNARVIMFHKPKGVAVTRSDERARRTVYDVLPLWFREQGWVPAGRLDRSSRGMLLFARDGRLIDLLTRPGHCTKTYEVWVRGRVTDEHRRRIADGVDTPWGPLSAVQVQVLGGAGPKTRLRVVLDRGKNRHIRRMLGALRDPQWGTPLKVLEVKRTAIGPIRLDVASGCWRPLDEEETRLLLAPRPPAGGLPERRTTG